MINLDIVKEKPEDYPRLKQLIYEGKHEEALQIIEKIKEKGGHSHHDILLYTFLKCEILYQQGLHTDLFKLAEQIYQESLELGDKLLSVDALFLMAEALIWLGETNKAEEIIKQGEELLKTQTQAPTVEVKQMEARLFYVKGLFYMWLKMNPDLAMEHLERSIELGKESNAEQEVVKSLIIMAWVLLYLKGEFNRALEVVERILALPVVKNNKFVNAVCFMTKAVIYMQKGELNRSIEISEKSLKIYEELNNKYAMALVLNNMSEIYIIIGDLERALECIESSIKINNELGNLHAEAFNHDSLIKVLLDKGDLERARVALEKFEKMKNQLNNKQIDLIYMFDKALILKTSARARDRGKAEEILKNIIEDEKIPYEFSTNVLLNLCDLLLTELRMTNDLDVLGEINSFTTKLLEIAEKNHSFTLFAEIYFLKAKLALLTLDVKTARRFLTQAQKIAERFGLNQLTAKISIEHNTLLDQLHTWENLQKSDISLTERIKLAGLDKHMKEILQKSANITTQISEHKVTIHRDKKICLVCKGEIRGYMYVCDCDVIYCENCVRALTDLENECWVCNAALDISKPTKPYKIQKLDEKDVIKDTKKIK